MKKSFTSFLRTPFRYSSPITPSSSHLKREERNDDLVSFDDIFKIVIILDESGSMKSIKLDMINAINSLIDEQKQVEGKPATFTMVKFSDKIQRTIMNKNLKDINKITSCDYSPNGSTALYDAIGDTIKWFRNEKNVLMVIVTDGQENASTNYDKEEIEYMINEKKKTHGWTYVYLSNDLKTAAQGNSIGLVESSVITNKIVQEKSFGNFLGVKLNSAITEHRRSGLSVQSQL